MKSMFFFFFVLFFSCKNETSIKHDVIGIQPYNAISNEKVVMISKSLSDFYQVKTIVLPNKKLPRNAFVNIKSPRYRADTIIRIQDNNFPATLNYIMGLTDEDISVTKKEKDGTTKKPLWRYNDFGVMGLAYCPGKSAIVSTFRLKSKNSKLAFTRFEKVVIHEFGHNLGLPHCPNNHCVMTSANEKISTIDNEKMDLCTNCKKKINYKEDY